MKAVWHFLWDNGIGQNITASALLAVPTLLYARLKMLPAIRQHMHHVKDLHKHHLPHLHPEDDQ